VTADQPERWAPAAPEYHGLYEINDDLDDPEVRTVERKIMCRNGNPQTIHSRIRRLRRRRYGQLVVTLVHDGERRTLDVRRLQQAAFGNIQ
jgi:hypothetical protein